MIMRLLQSKKSIKTKATRAHTSVRFSASDVTALAELVVAGQALLRQTGPAHPVIGRLKAAMTRLHAPIPHGM
jgi:hypothetical protein